MTTLVVAPCTREAAQHAVLNWHYSRRMPVGKLVCLGVWEDDKFIGAVIFGRGSNDRLLRPYGLTQAEGCELVRVALTDHRSTVTRVVSEALTILKRTNPGLRIVVSFADPTEGHKGGIYQAGNWLYLGLTAVPPDEYTIKGRRTHARTVSAMIAGGKYGRPDKGEARLAWLRRCVDPNTQPIRLPGKHRYVMPLDKPMRRKVARVAQPYPKQP